MCDESFGELAKEVPFSHHVNSTIVCSISGKIMNEDNQPMVFPGGYVYSREVRRYLCLGDHGIVVRFADTLPCEISIGFGRDGCEERRDCYLSSVRRAMRVFEIEESLRVIAAYINPTHYIQLSSLAHPMLYPPAHS